MILEISIDATMYTIVPTIPCQSFAICQGNRGIVSLKKERATPLIIIEINSINSIERNTIFAL
jgi:hypothetical protein